MALINWILTAYLILPSEIFPQVTLPENPIVISFRMLKLTGFFFIFMMFYIFWKKYKFLKILVGVNLKHLPIKNNDLHFRIRILYFDP